MSLIMSVISDSINVPDFTSSLYYTFMQNGKTQVCPSDDCPLEGVKRVGRGLYSLSVKVPEQK